MLYRRVKQMFKRKKKAPEPIYKLEPSDFKMHTIFKGRAEEGGFRWDINGIEIEAEDILTAQREYLEQTGQEGEE